jgi:hypothetical protein
MSRESDDAVFRGLAAVTNRRQAAKILDADAIATLQLVFSASREWYARGVAAGLWTVGYTRKGAVYLARCLSIGVLQRAARNEATSVDVIHERGALPAPIQHPPEHVVALEDGGGR